MPVRIVRSNVPRTPPSVAFCGVSHDARAPLLATTTRCCLWHRPLSLAQESLLLLTPLRTRDRAECNTTAAVNLSCQQEKKCNNSRAADPKNQKQRRERKQARILQPDTGIMTFEKLLGPLLKDSAENDIPTAAALEGKVVAFYFSASWCVSGVS